MALDRSALLAQAVAPMLARVRAHRDQLDYPGRALLEYLENHIFDTDLGVGSWRRACKAKGVTAVHQAQAVIGTTLGVYLEELRVETAMRLMVIAGGEWPCGDVGLMVGYEREETFREAFQRKTGLTSGAYRRQVLSLRELGRRPPAPLWVRSGWLEQLAEGTLEPAEALAALDEVAAAYGVPGDSAREESATPEWAGYERWLAQTWWPLLRQLPLAEQRRRVIRGFKPETPAFCNYLLAQVEAESRADAAAGIETAEFALEQALEVAGQLGEAEQARLLACAWAWVGYARRHAHDATGAAQAFRCAEEHWLVCAAPAVVGAEVLTLKVGSPVPSTFGVTPGADAAGLAPRAETAGLAPGADAAGIWQWADAARLCPRADAQIFIPDSEIRRDAGDVQGSGESREAGVLHGDVSSRARRHPTTTAGLPCPGCERSAPPCPIGASKAPLAASPFGKREGLEALIVAELEATLYSVRRDAARAPARWRPFFAELERRLFERSLRVKTWRRKHRLAQPEQTERFAAAYGCDPGEYVTKRRIETVQALLHIRALTAWESGLRVGFTSRSSFEKAFFRLRGKRPSAARAELAAANALQDLVPAAEPAHLAQMFALQLAPEELAGVSKAVRSCWAAVLCQRPPVLETFETQVAAEWWWRARRLPHPEKRRRAAGWFETPALFELLWRASREEGRDDRRRGLEVAGLALGSLIPLRGLLDPGHLAELETRGLAELGNAHRLLFDFATAETILAIVEGRLAERDYPPILRGTVLNIKSYLRREQRRLHEALQISHHAIELGWANERLRGEMMINRGILLAELGDFPKAASDFRAALEALRHQREPYLTWLATHDLALASCALGDYAEAQRWVERAEPAVLALRQRAPLCLFHWLLGLLATAQGDDAKAEPHLRRAHGGYESLGDIAQAAVVSLDLAQLYLRRGRPVEAGWLAAEALPQLRAISLDAEGIAALNLLHQSLATEKLGAAVLKRVRACAARAVHAPDLQRS